MIKLMILVLALGLLLHTYRQGRLLSSVSVWLLAYVMIFVVYPVFGLTVEISNEGLIDWLALLGILCFSAGVLLGKKVRVAPRRRLEGSTLLVPDFHLAHWVFWISFGLSLLILYIRVGPGGFLSLIRGGTTAKKLALTYKTTQGAFVFTLHLLEPCILMLWITAANKKERGISLLCFLLYVLEMVLFGFTRIFMVTIFMVLFFYSARRLSRKRQLRLALAGMACGMLLMTLLNFIRTFGWQAQTSFGDRLELSYIFGSTDFGASYKWFSRLLEYGSPHISPSFYLKPVFALIPRSIWPEKMQQLSLQLLKQIDPLRAATGYSTAGNSVLGEGFAILGYPGIALFPFLWGYVCMRLDKRYYERLEAGEDQCLRNIFYYLFAVFIVISGQRGDWSQYNTILLYFYVLPMAVLSKVSVRIGKHG